MKSIHLLVWTGMLVLAISSATAQNPGKFIQQLIPPFPEHLIPEEPKGRVLGPGLFNHIRPVREAYHSGSTTFAGHTPEGELYLRNEGEDEIKIIAQPEPGWRWDIADALWSPRGKQLLVRQVNDQEVPRIQLTQADTLIYRPYSRAGEPLPKFQYYVITPATKTVTPVDHGLTKPYIHPLSWSKDGKEIRILRADRLMKTLELLRVDPRTGMAETWFKDSTENYLIGLDLLQGYTGRLQKANFFYFLDDREQFIYESERSGYYQLYLYNEDGDLLRPLTNYKENGLVSHLVEVNHDTGWVYFIAQGDTKEPYAEQLYRTSLNSTSIQKIVDGPYFTEIFFSEAKDSLWVWRNDMEKYSKLEIYDPAGEKLSSHWSADMSALTGLGFAPEFEQLPATDAETFIETMILKPKDFDSHKKYPVVEWIYGAAHTNAIHRTALHPINIQLQNLANSGFIVVIIDGRGTPGRGAKFRNFSYGKFGQLEIKDHVYALQQLASKHPYMNLEQLGISGHSWGGHYALRAVLEHPDFYKAAHLSAAAIDPARFRIAIEPYMGCLPADCPEAYERSALTPKLGSLKAPLLIHHGSADDDVPITDSYQLVKALKERNYKNFEFKEFEGMDHIIMRNPKWEQDMIKFFKKELGKAPVNVEK
ncbi:prolyl oligopeptidase family serine peptidase [Gramella jeungdoensis]|uniref:Prolyl oligopeptidase family serine peptidase n=1 Tax=Gramella jeungdoensis TaxID=708091 RepID=A0ABT0YZK2_9FLAO|nr:prolyl oligopeptidase family serine peptidase [Gramella jeungdoensis]MCM8568901.1 prolyl oligopeptidase family serine peptidase [Gramella jeungdoensis]